MAELTLALVLFTDAAQADLDVLKISLQIPGRLLLVGLPLTILMGFSLGVLIFPGIPLFEIAVLATMLAPTDAALGKAVVTNMSVPAALREGLNVESGFNDGICVPVLLVFLALATHAVTHESGFHLALLLVMREIGIGAAVGLLRQHQAYGHCGSAPNAIGSPPPGGSFQCPPWRFFVSPWRRSLAAADSSPPFPAGSSSGDC